MSILDDAIREHLELKRAHGADEAELKRLEDEAFGPAERPGASEGMIDPFAEAPTEFLTTPGGPAAGSAERRVPNVADLQEPPPPRPAESEADAEASGAGAEPPADEAAPEPPAAAEQLAGEYGTTAQPATADRPAAVGEELRPDPDAPGGEPPAEERQAITEQPTEMFDVEQQLFEDTAQSASPSDEELIDAERSEPRITAAPAEQEPADEFDEFFSEQRLSDELSQALDTPLEDEPGLPSTEEALAGIPPLPSEEEEAEAPAPAPEDASSERSGDESRGDPPPADELSEPPLDHTVEQPLPEPPRAEEEDDAEDEYRPHEPGHADALEDTPEFLEDAPEDEDAWFEQKPPKDFDFGD